MLAAIVSSCGLFWWLLIGCADESHVPVTNTAIEMNRQSQETERQRIEAMRQSVQEGHRAAVERAAIQATTEAHNANVSADIAAQQAHERIQKNYDTQVFLNDRFAWQERGRTERFNSLMIVIAALGTVGGIVVIIVAVSPARERSRRHLPPVAAHKFRAAADREGWLGWEVHARNKKLIGTDSNGKKWLIMK